MIPAPLLYIHGNHDYRYRRHAPEGCICIDDKVFTYNGVRFMGLGGVLGVRGDELFEYTEKQMRARIRRRFFDVRRARGIDVLVSHAPAEGIGDLTDDYHRGFAALRELDEKLKPKFHFYGHVHKRYGASCAPVAFGETMCINACGYKIIEI